MVLAITLVELLAIDVQERDTPQTLVGSRMQPALIVKKLAISNQHVVVSHVQERNELLFGQS